MPDSASGSWPARPQRSDYNVAIGWRIAGELDTAALRGAMQYVADRHEILRTTFYAVDGQPWQRIVPRRDVSFAVTDLSAEPASAREAELARCLAEEIRRPFDLAMGPLNRGRLIRLAERDHVLALTRHHAVCGGDSGKITAREMGAAYDALHAGRAPDLPPVAIQYSDYVTWQREHLTPERLEALTAYWRTRLAGAPAALTLPADWMRPRSGTPTGRGRRSTSTPAVRALGRSPALQSHAAHDVARGIPGAAGPLRRSGRRPRGLARPRKAAWNSRS
jgi:hypothetical protein